MSKVAFGKSISTSSFTKLTTPLGRRSANASPLRSSNTSSRTTLIKSTSKPDPFDSKASTIDKSHPAFDTSPWTTLQKQASNLISDSFLCGNLVSEDNSLDISSFNIPSNNHSYLQLKVKILLPFDFSFGILFLFFWVLSWDICGFPLEFSSRYPHNLEKMA